MSAQPSAPEIRRLETGPMGNNVYIVVDPETNRGVIVDASEAAPIIEAARGLEIEYILLTHGDADHIEGLEELKRAYPVPVGIHAADAGRLSTPPDFEIEDGQEISFGNATLRTMHTPGHSPGSISLYTPGTLLSGDTLFPGGPGNTRDDKERFEQIIASITEKLFVLPDDTAVLPGHGEGTTIGAEKPSLQEWIDRGY
ncbi:MAG: MBL fold metallo-hydrolase [Chloroflexota bacterium]|nr:MBL fold metallo-hydrolase [Chloroflexota bacterium]